MTTRRLRPPWQARLAARLALVIGLALVGVEGLRMGFGYHEDRVEAERQARAFLVEVTRQRAEAIASRLATVMQATRSAAWFLGSEHLDGKAETAFETIAGVIEQAPDIYGSAIAFPQTAGGALYYIGKIEGKATRVRNTDAELHFTEREWFTGPVASGKPYWTAPYYDDGIGETQMVTYSVPWKTPEGATAVVTADIALADFDTGWESPWGGASRIVDRTGTYLSKSGDIRAPEENIFAVAEKLDLPEVREAGKAMQRGDSGLLEVPVPNVPGGSVWMSWAPIHGTEWSLLALLYEGRVLANAQAQLLHQLLVSLAALFTGLLILAFATRRLTRPLDELRRVADAIQQGDHSQRALDTGRHDEIGQFARTFNAMLDTLAESQADRLQEAEARQRIEGELGAAREIQRRLLPPPWPEWSALAGPTPGFEFHGLCEPATIMSGDFYDAWMLDADTVALVIADVCGKGTAAALYMTLARTHLRDFSRPGRGPGATLADVNRALVEGRHEGMFLTLILAHYHWRDGRFDYVTAGHPPPCVLRANGAVEMPGGHSALVGAFAELEYAQQQVALTPGDSVLLYTDGVTEAADADGALYGNERLATLLGEHVGANPTGLCDAVVTDVLGYAQGEAQDDVTLLALRRTPA